MVVIRSKIILTYICLSYFFCLFTFQNCTPGEYCAGDYLNITSGLCDEGFYCTLAASVPNPTDGITGQQDSQSTLSSRFYKFMYLGKLQYLHFCLNGCSDLYRP